MIMNFERSVYASAIIDGPVHDLNDAAVYAAIALENGDAFNCEYTGDNFSESDFDIPVPPTRRFKCIGSPFEVKRHSIDIVHSGEDYSSIRFYATQQCIYFAPGITDPDIAMTMACVAAASDDVQQCIDVEKDKNYNRWVISAPTDVPNLALMSCFKNYASKQEDPTLYVAVPLKKSSQTKREVGA